MTDANRKEQAQIRAAVAVERWLGQQVRVP